MFATVGRAFFDVVRAARAMPLLALAAVIVGALYALAHWVFRLPASDSALTEQTLLLQFAVDVARAILIAPVLIAVFRFIVMNKVTRGYALDVGHPRVRRFCAWLIVLAMLTLASSLTTQISGIEGGLSTAVDLLLIVAAFGVVVALALLFPAIAVDAPGASLRNAMADLRGSFWRAVGVLCLITLPVLVLFFIVLIGAEAVAEIDAIQLVGWIPVLCWELLWTAAASRLFLALAERLRSPVSR
ncbi:MAG: hypothetical protein K8F62_02225 [Pseudorhodoplanes sp.]|nr:hypothetical protein [Pseudorhodoplanes sp.]